MVRITNSATRKKERLPQRTSGEVTLYVCGVTVYDDCHVGHARSAVIFDVIRNYLEYKDFVVRYVKNYTDIDDKIIARAKKEGTTWREVSERFVAAYERDVARLSVRSPSLAPKASEHIPEIIQMIDRLVFKRMAYAVDGDVYFEVKRFAPYGKLSHRKRDEMFSGARVEVDPRKRSPLDFALWKSSKPGEPSWESPWGLGRPGWHIECSAMAIKHLGETIDLHGGGEDLIFPHHENEIAQSEGATGKEFVSCWIHHSFVTIDQEKMSKSLGNFFTVDEIFTKSSQLPEKVLSEVLRFYLLSTHYRSPVNFSDEGLKAAKHGLDNFYTLFQKVDEHSEADSGLLKQGERSDQGDLKSFQSNFEAAMDDDFNTPRAISALQTLRSEINHRLEQGDYAWAVSAVHLLRTLGSLLGLFRLPPVKWRFKAWDLEMDAPDVLNEEAIQKLIAEREDARRKRDWTKSDKIRDQLASAGIIIEDRPDGTTRIKR